MPRTLFGKTRDVSEPYAVYHGLMFGEPAEFRVLKTYKHHDAERKDPYARWFLASRSAGTYGSWEYGDGYARDIRAAYVAGYADPEWIAAYGEGMELPEGKSLDDVIIWETS